MSAPSGRAQVREGLPQERLSLSMEGMLPALGELLDRWRTHTHTHTHTWLFLAVEHQTLWFPGQS